MTVAALRVACFVVDEDACKGCGCGWYAFFEAAGKDAGLRVDLHGQRLYGGCHDEGIWRGEGEGLAERTDQRFGEVEPHIGRACGEAEVAVDIVEQVLAAREGEVMRRESCFVAVVGAGLRLVEFIPIESR